jgi:hypothetical protein
VSYAEPRPVVRVAASEGAVHELPYDHVVIALGAATNMNLVAGSEHARTRSSREVSGNSR